MAIDFPGVDAYLLTGTDAGDLNTPSAFTVCFWLNMDSLVIGDAFCNKVTATTNGWMIRTITATQDFTFWFGGGTASNGRVVGGITTGTWAHWACVFDGGGAGNADRCKIYKNGAEQSLTFTNTIPAAPVTTSAQNILVGINGVTAQFIDGKMQNLIAWNRALTAAQVASQVYLRRPVSAAGLQFWYAMDAVTSDSQILDLSGNGHTTTKQGTPLLVTGYPIGFGAPHVMA